MIIREATTDDLGEITQLFYDTINAVNKKDYGADQLRVWSAGAGNRERWLAKIQQQQFFVAESGGIVSGFASLTAEGCIDFLFVHKDLQGRGIASGLLAKLEAIANELHMESIWSDVSITARPFFTSRGFVITKIHIKIMEGVSFENVIMTKILR